MIQQAGVPIRVIYDGCTEIERTSNYSHGCRPVVINRGVFPSLAAAMAAMRVSDDDLEPNGKDAGWMQYQGGQNALLFIPASHACLKTHMPYAEAIDKAEDK